MRIALADEALADEASFRYLTAIAWLVVGRATYMGR
jgi:hypothetical protein